ncbi:MAG TPA: SH3 domain-containing protein, partial [Herpetosiphonaceae bacterium]
PAVSREDMREEVRREVRREARRRGCFSFIRRRVIGLLFLAALAGGCYWGFTYGLNWFTSGEAKAWACGYIPKMACDLLPGSTKAAIVNYVTTTAMNIRSSPTTVDPKNVLAQVPAGTRLTWTGEKRDVEGLTWVRVSLVFENRKLDGWAAQDLLQEETTP